VIFNFCFRKNISREVETLPQYKLKWNPLKCVIIEGSGNISEQTNLQVGSFTKPVKM
jgi:hypothetical protein